MKAQFKYLVALFLVLTVFAEVQGQFGYGQGGYGYGGGGYGYGGYGRGLGRGRGIPQAETPAEPPKPKTAEEIVDGEMPSIVEALGLDEFETAILSSVLKKYVQERIEARILELPPQKMKEVYTKITERQDAELKAGLPLEKYEAFVKMQKEGVAQTIRNQKKAEKKRNQKKKKTKE
jgi:hypothetical protein